MTTFKEYYEKYEQYVNGDISDRAWAQFAEKVFTEILEENREVFVRFLNEWAK